MHAHGECSEGVASVKPRDLERRRARYAVGGRGRKANHSYHVRIELGERNRRGKVVDHCGSRLARARPNAALKIFLAFDSVFKTHCQLKSKIVDVARKLTENLVFEAAAALPCPLGGDARQRTTREVVEALRLVARLAGVGTAPDLARQIVEARCGKPCLLVQRAARCGAEEPGLAGLDGERRALAAGHNRIPRAVKDQLGGRLLDDVHVVFCGAVELAPLCKGQLLGSEWAAERIRVERTIGHALIGNVASKGVEFFFGQQRNTDRRNEPQRTQFRKATGEAGRASSRVESREDALHLFCEPKVGCAAPSEFAASLGVERRIED